MAVQFRQYRLYNRLLRKPRITTNYKNITGTAVKEEINIDLLNSFNNDIKKGGVVPVFRRALLFPSRAALNDEVGIYTYAGLHQAATELSKVISAELVGDTDRTISYMCSNNASHVIVQWAIWMSGNIAVPLTPIHPAEMLKYYITDSESKLIVTTPEYEKILQPIASELGKKIIINNRTNEIQAQLYQPSSSFNKPKEEVVLQDIGRSNQWYGSRDAFLIYTSGTTSKPKGVVWTHSMLSTQIAALHTAWQYSAEDVVLHTLPLHHIHGQLNSLNASLAAGSRIRMLPSFTPHTVWSRLLGMGEREEWRVSALHGVPAAYRALCTSYDALFTEPRARKYVRDVLSARVRIMCVGSAPLPDSLASKWFEISGHRLLERYGMSEAGMALSNPYRPIEERRVACVGLPLPGISACIAVPKDEETGEMKPLITVDTPMCETQICLERLGVASKDYLVDSEDFEWKRPVITRHVDAEDGVYQGELLLKGPGIFTRYWNRAPKLGSKDFTPDGWFRTGDTASFSDNRFRILGRTSVDIIKTSGYKVSALQVESALLEHSKVLDAAVLGIDNDKYGEIVAAVVVVKQNEKLTLNELKSEAGKKLAPYQLPKTMLIVETMPRNVMGKLDKKQIRKLYEKDLAYTKSV